MYDHPSRTRRPLPRRAGKVPNSTRRCGRAVIMRDIWFRREQFGGDAALIVVGEVDGFSAPTFRRELLKLMNVGLHAGVELVLRAPSLPVRRMLAVSGASDMFRLDDER